MSYKEIMNVKILKEDKSITLSIVCFSTTAVLVVTLSIEEKADRFFLAWYCHLMKYVAYIRINHWSCKTQRISHIIFA